MMPSLRQRSYTTLLTGARQANPAAIYDDQGYAAYWEQNLVQDLHLDLIRKDLASGAGRELGGKLRAAHSSAALAINTFGIWRHDASRMRLSECDGFRSIHFEAVCPTGCGGTPPHLDLLAEGDLPVALESKCTEWMEAKTAVFSASYDRLRLPPGILPWVEQMHHLRASPNLYRFLDAAQLVKHAFGLSRRYGDRRVKLVYVYWEPRNASAWPECAEHRNEADALASKVMDATVRLTIMSYRDLWLDWEHNETPNHLHYLRLRYDRDASDD